MASPELAEALLQAARILDIGRTVDFFDRHEHVADLVLATDLGGFSHRQVALLAAIVRRAGDEDVRPRSWRRSLGREDRAAGAGGGAPGPGRRDHRALPAGLHRSG